MMAASPGGRSNAKQREVAGASAEITDQDQFIMVEIAFVKICGRDGFVLESHGADTSLVECACEAVECKLIVFVGVCVGIMHGTADNDATFKRPDLFFRRLSQVSEDDRDQIFNRVGSFIDGRGSE